jgi:hypothetical protein
MEKLDLYFQVFVVIWVVGGSLFVISKSDWIVRLNARFGIKVNAKFIRILFTCTLAIGIIGAIEMAIRYLGKRTL